MIINKKITIIGAGLSGLYLAYLLQDKYEITILEARERLGGRVFSIFGHDMGPSWIWQHHKNILELIDKLELELFMQETDGYALYDTKDKVEMFTPQPSAPSVRMKGSLNMLIDTLYRKLKNVKIIFSEEVVSIEKLQNVVTKTHSNSYESDFVISTLSPRLALKINYTPELPQPLKVKMLQTQTWMGNSAKCVVEFRTAFWKKNSLSGFVFSHIGPLSEIHDASNVQTAALFGFISSGTTMNDFEELVIKQMVRVFGIDKEEITNIYLVDWREEKYSATVQDAKPLREHPQYGIDTTNYSKKILFSATEFSFKEGGYLEGAIIRAKEIASLL